MFKYTSFIATLVIMMVPALAHAHEGHTDTSFQATEILHYITSPLHTIPLVVGIIAIGVAIRLFRSQKKEEQQ